MSDSAFFFLLWLLIVALAIGVLAATYRIDAYCRKLNENPVFRSQAMWQVYFFQGMRLFLWALTAMLAIGGVLYVTRHLNAEKQAVSTRRNALIPVFEKGKLWNAPDNYLAQTDPQAALIRYGRDLISHTQDYFGPTGLVRANSINGMNCQNCHLDAGTKPFGNNYFAVQSLYPQFRSRSGSLETIPKRVNDCFERSLNGQPLDTAGREMLAILAYVRWLGTGIPKGEKPKGAGLVDMPYLDRAADPARGKNVYFSKCATCHGPNGQGLPIPESARTYPPLWGDKSYNAGAGLFRLSRFAAYVKANMPFGASFENPQLSNEEAWDVAAFVNSQPRPAHPFLKTDWPDISKKPVDHPFGPYVDPFPEAQHKYGPFGPVAAFYKKGK
jgi:thiosulfate dehydrogenase